MSKRPKSSTAEGSPTADEPSSIETDDTDQFDIELPASTAARKPTGGFEGGRFLTLVGIRLPGERHVPMGTTLNLTAEQASPIRQFLERVDGKG